MGKTRLARVYPSSHPKQSECHAHWAVQTQAPVPPKREGRRPNLSLKSLRYSLSASLGQSLCRPVLARTERRSGIHSRGPGGVGDVVRIDVPIAARFRSEDPNIPAIIEHRKGVN